MGYEFENRLDPPEVYPTGYFTETGFSMSYTKTMPGSSRSQYGYRSGPLGQAEMESVQFLNDTGTKADSAQQIDALERLARATSPAPLSRQSFFDVNHRDYNSLELQNGSLSWVGHYDWGGDHNVYTCHGVAGFRSLPLLSVPTEEWAQAEAGGIIRSYRPTRPDFDLTRFVGELKDANQIFNLAKLPSGSAGYAASPGSAYLGYQFGVAPTGDDIMRGAEAVLQGDEKVRQFAQDSAQLVRRTSTRSVDSNWQRGQSGSPSYGDGDITIAGCTVTADVGVRSTRPGKPRFIVNMTQNVEIRVSSTFEYYVGDPGQFVSRMDYYKDRARKTLGSGFTPSVAYELTPWSWMVDWFYDIGGLLAYQQDVADYSLVQRRGSVVRESVTKAEGHIIPYGSNADRRHVSSASGGFTAVRKEQHRSPGSPYSAKPNWDLNGFQWSILGALGLTKAPGVAAILNKV